MTVGKFKELRSFTGFAGELFLYFYPLSKYDIQEHYEDGLKEIQTGDGEFIFKELQKDEAQYNRRLYATEKHIPEEALQDLDVSPDLFI